MGLQANDLKDLVYRIFEVDSYLVAKHMAPKEAWTCKADVLQPLHVKCRELGAQLTAKGITWEVRHHGNVLTQ